MRTLLRPLSPQRFLLLTGALLVVPTLFRLFMIGRFDLGNDEAHYFMYALHPAASYFDHPLMVALLIRAGIFIGGTTAFGVRLFAPILFLLSTVILLMIALLLRPSRRMVLGTLLLVNAVPLFGYLGSMLILPDAPLSVFWLLHILVATVLFSRYDSLDRKNRSAGWLLLGATFGLALLSKYNGLLLAGGIFLFLLLSPRHRARLLTPAPYLALLGGLLLATPLFLWNSRHGWVSFAFQGTHGMGSSHAHFSWVHFYQMVFGQMGYVSPLLFVLLLWTLVRLLRASPPEQADPLVLRLLLVFSLLPLLFFNAIGILHPILPHWPAMGYLTALPLLALLWGAAPRSRLSSWTLAGVLLGASMAALTTVQLFFRPLVLPPTVPLWVDITNDLFGYRRLAKVIEAELARHPERVTPEFFFAAEHFNTADLLVFYLGNSSHTICLSHETTGFDFWSDPHRFVGQNGLFVSTDKYRVDPAKFYPPGTFDRVIPLEPFVVMRNGHPARIFYMAWVIGFRHVPFRP
ncbi:MAG: glycosyltransferase family 39 protein [Leptospirales bacterium]